MTKPKRSIIPQSNTVPPWPIGVRELGRFSHASLDKCKALSKDLDELEDVMHFNLEPMRRRLRSESIAAIQKNPAKNMPLTRWVRIVDYKFSSMPLFSAGSLTGIWGRFNAGMDLEEGTPKPWPALYLAEDDETAFREKFQLKSSDCINGLSPQELALEHKSDDGSPFHNGLSDSCFFPSQSN